MRSHLLHRGIVAAIVLSTIVAAVAVHFAAAHQLDRRRADRLSAARHQVSDALRRRAYFLEDVADMVGVHDDADATEFSRYAHVRGRNERAVVSVQWLRRSPSGKLSPPASTGPSPILVFPADHADRPLAHAPRQAVAAEAIKRATQGKEVGVSAPVTLGNGDPAFYLSVPVEARAYSGSVSRTESRSAMVGLIDAQALLTQAIDPAVIAGLRLADGRTTLGTAGSGLRNVQHTSIPVDGRRWTISVDGGTLSGLERVLPWLILLLGTALATAVSLVLRTAARRRDEALRLAEERSNALAVTLDRVERSNRDLEQAHAEAERRSRIDALTGIYNRRHFSEVLAAELAHRREDGLTAAVLLLDLDHFKQINDEHGHLMGDAVLRVVAGRIGAILRTTDTLARWGGEEFAILAPGMSHAAMLDLAERARETLSASPVVVGAAQFDLRVSVGAALTGPGLETPDRVVDAADQALYEAKRAGRDCVRIH